MNEEKKREYVRRLIADEPAGGCPRLALVARFDDERDKWEGVLLVGGRLVQNRWDVLSWGFTYRWDEVGLRSAMCDSGIADLGDEPIDVSAVKIVDSSGFFHVTLID